MPTRRTTRTTRSQQAPAQPITDPKVLHRLAKLMGSLGLSPDKGTVTFVLGDEPTVQWTEPQS
jgi:hypothetical protein